MEKPLNFSSVVIDENKSWQEFHLLDGDFETNIYINRYTNEEKIGPEEYVLVDIFDRLTGNSKKLYSTDFIELPFEFWKQDIINLKNDVILSAAGEELEA